MWVCVCMIWWGEWVAHLFFPLACVFSGRRGVRRRRVHCERRLHPLRPDGQAGVLGHRHGPAQTGKKKRFIWAEEEAAFWQSYPRVPLNVFSLSSVIFLYCSSSILIPCLSSFHHSWLTVNVNSLFYFSVFNFFPLLSTFPSVFHLANLPFSVVTILEFLTSIHYIEKNKSFWQPFSLSLSLSLSDHP